MGWGKSTWAWVLGRQGSYRSMQQLPAITPGHAHLHARVALLCRIDGLHQRPASKVGSLGAQGLPLRGCVWHRCCAVMVSKWAGFL